MTKKTADELFAEMMQRDSTAVAAIDALAKAVRPKAAPTGTLTAASLPADLMTREFAPYAYAWGRYYPLRNSSVLIAEGSAGKSMLTLAQQLHGAAGKPYLGMPTREGVYVYLSAEDDTEVVWRRAQKILAEFTAGERAKVQANFKMIDGVGRGLRFVMFDYGVASIAPVVDEVIATIKAAANGREVVHVACDTVSRLNAGPENNETMSAVEQVASRMAQALGCACSLLHHVSKAVARSGVADHYAGRGGGSLGDNCRSVLRLLPLTPDLAEKARLADVDAAAVARGDVLVLVHAKLNLERKSDPVYLQRQANGTLVRIEPRFRTEDSELRALVEWFNGPQKKEPFSQRYATRTAREQWTTASVPEAQKLVKTWIERGRLIAAPTGKGGHPLYIPAADALGVHVDTDWLDTE